MDNRLNKILTVTLIVFGAVNLRFFFLTGKVKDYFENRLTEPLKMAIYIEEDSSEEDIRLLRKEIEDFKPVAEENFFSPDQIFNKMYEDPAIEPQLDLIRENFVFPPTMELNIKKLMPDNIEKINHKLLDKDYVKRVEAPFETINIASKFNSRIKYGLDIIKWVCLTGAMVFFIMAGYMFYGISYQEIIFGLKNNVAFMKVVQPVLKTIFIFGVMAGITAAFLWDYFFSLLGVAVVTTVNEVAWLTGVTIMLTSLFFVLTARFGKSGYDN